MSRRRFRGGVWKCKKGKGLQVRFLLERDSGLRCEGSKWGDNFT